MAKKYSNRVVRVKILKDFEVQEGFVAKMGKEGSFTEETARKMIKAKAAKEIVYVNSEKDIKEAKPYVEPEKESELKTKEEKFKPVK